MRVVAFGMFLCAGCTASSERAQEWVVAVLGATRLQCSGTLVAPRAVLTAAHCVADATAPPSSVRDARGGSFEVTSVTVDPAFHKNEDGTLSHDLALLSLGEPSSLKPARLPGLPLDLSPGDSLAFWGFGGRSSADGPTLHGGTVRVIDADTDHVRVAPAPTLFCGGDSGGPALLRVGAEEVVVGIASYADAACEIYGVETRVAPDRGFAWDTLARLARGQALATPRPLGASCTTDGMCETRTCVFREGTSGGRCRWPCHLELGCAEGATCQLTGRDAAPYACLPNTE